MSFGSFFEQVGNSMGRPLGLGSPAGKSAYEGSIKDWKNESGKWVDAWGNVNKFTDENGDRTPVGQRFDELSNLYTGEVNRGEAEQSQRTAGAYSRRGMGDSGYGTAAQMEGMMKAAQARAAAREAARSSAVGEQGAITGEQAKIDLDPYSAMFQSASQRFIGNESQWNDFLNKQALMREQAVLKMATNIGGIAAGGGFGG